MIRFGLGGLAAAILLMKFGESPVLAVKGDEPGDVDVGHAVAIGEAECFAAEIRRDAL